MTLVTGVDFTIIPTKDIDKAVDFYENVLGLTVVLADGTRLEADLVVVAAGIRPNVDLALKADLHVAGAAEAQGVGAGVGRVA